MEASLM